MRKSLLFVVILCVITASQTSCSVIPSANELPLEPSYKPISITSIPSGAEVYMEGKYIGVTPFIANVPLKYKFLMTGWMSPRERYNRSANMCKTTFKFVKAGYKTEEVVFKPAITKREKGYKNYDGQVWALDYLYPEGIYANMKPTHGMSMVDTTIPAGESSVEVSRDTPGASGLEKTVIRWFFDSEPRGARVFWRVISSIPAQVKNTNESYLGTTPFEETRSFNILGLTYENSRDVQIEIKITKPGYMDQTKRFNVSQAIDQMEISSFYDLVPKE